MLFARVSELSDSGCMAEQSEPADARRGRFRHRAGGLEKFELRANRPGTRSFWRCHSKTGSGTESDIWLDPRCHSRVWRLVRAGAVVAAARSRSLPTHYPRIFCVRFDLTRLIFVPSSSPNTPGSSPTTLVSQHIHGPSSRRHGKGAEKLP